MELTMKQSIRQFRAYVRSKLPKKIVKLYWIKLRKVSNPYKPHHDLYQSIFIKIPKTAGTSITKALFNTGSGHAMSEHYEIFGPEKFNSYFKFAFVRNPWDRFLSAYIYLKQGGDNSVDRNWADIHLSKFDNFEDFVLSLKDKKQAQKILEWMHFAPQYLYVCDHKMNIKVDFIGHFENINSDFNYVKEKLGINGSLKHFRKSKRGNYEEYYTQQTQEIVAYLYKEDIKIFNYTFSN